MFGLFIFFVFAVITSIIGFIASKTLRLVSNTVTFISARFFEMRALKITTRHNNRWPAYITYVYLDRHRYASYVYMDFTPTEKSWLSRPKMGSEAKFR